MPEGLEGKGESADAPRLLSDRFDHIIIDSPPLITVTDPVILSTMVDGSMLVVQSGRSTKELIRRARQELAGVNARIFGVILNNVDIMRDGYDEFYYHRYYSDYNAPYYGSKKTQKET